MKFHLRSYIAVALLGFSVAAWAKSPVWNWQVSFELAFGDGSPYSREMKPSLYEVPYATSYQVTSTVLPDIARRAQIMAGLESKDLYFGPGGYEKYVNPSAQMIIRGTPGQARLACSIIGYLAQQTEVIASRPDAHGDVQTYELLGFRSTGLDRLKPVQANWTKLNSLNGKLVGFLPIQGKWGGIRVLNMGDAWSRDDVAGFNTSVSNSFGSKVHVKVGRAHLLSSKNNWKAKPSGDAYLAEMRALGRPDIARRVQNMSGQVQNLVKKAYRKFIPQRSRRRDVR